MGGMNHGSTAGGFRVQHQTEEGGATLSAGFLGCC